MLRDFEREALFGIFTKALEAQKLRDDAIRRKEQAEEDIKVARATLKVAREALKIFNYDDSPSIWKEVRSALGEVKVNEARDIAGIARRNAISEIENPISERGAGDHDLESRSTEQIDGNIKSLVIKSLQDAADDGIKASEIKDQLKADGAEMHDKTVGMTLYRLSKEGLSRREGRNWFYVHTQKISQKQKEGELDTSPSNVSVFD